MESSSLSFLIMNKEPKSLDAKEDSVYNIPKNLFTKGKAPCSVNSMTKEQFDQAGERIENRLRQLKKVIGSLP